MDYNSYAQPKLRNTGQRKHHWVLIAVFVLNVVLPNLVLSYGSILASAVEDHDVRAWIAFATPVSFVGSFSMAQSWGREIADSFGSRFGYRWISIIGIMIASNGVFLCSFIAPLYHFLTYGILGGFGVCLISAQLDALLFDTFDTKLGLVKGLCISGQAIGQLFLPHLITYLIESFGYKMHFVLLSGIVLQTLPFALSLNAFQSKDRPYSMSRYSEYRKQYSSSIYSSEFDNNNFVNDIQLKDLNKKSWKCPSDEKVNCIDIKNFCEEDIEISPPPSPEEKRKYAYGVEILPDITEESEEERNDSKRSTMKNAITRFSFMSDKFDETINKKKATQNENVNGETNTNDKIEIDVTYNFVELREHLKKENDAIRNSLYKVKRRFRIPSYKMYKIRKRFRYFFRSIYDIFLEPLFRSLACWRFYPALILNVGRLCLLVQLPTLLQLYSNRSFDLSIRMGNTFISLHALSWLCLVFCFAWISSVPKENYKYLTLFGTIASTLAVSVITFATSVYTLRIGSILAGLGFGAITSTWEYAAKEFLGIRDWIKVQSALETLSGAGVLTIFACLLKYTSFEGELDFQMYILAAIQLLSFVIWLVIATVSIIYNVKVKIIRSNQSFLFD